MAVTRRALGDITNRDETATVKPGEPVKLGVKRSSTEEPWVEGLPLVDRRVAGCVQSAAEYAQDVFAYLRTSEDATRTAPDYLSGSREITRRIRAILVDWIIEVHYKFRLMPETLFLTVALIDRYLEKKPDVPKSDLQLIGVTALLLAGKYEEIYAVEIRDLVSITDKAYTRDMILDTEVAMLTTLGFSLTGPSSLQFAGRLLRVQAYPPSHVSLATYCLELALPEYTFLRYSQSHLAAAAVYLSNKVLKITPSWPQPLEEAAGYTSAEVRTCAKELCALLQNAEKAPLQAARKKFSRPEYHRVALTTVV